MKCFNLVLLLVVVAGSNTKGQALNVSFSTENIICRDEITTFTNTSICNNCGTVSYEWFFGNEGTSSQVSPVFSFLWAGPVNISLVGHTSEGETDSISQTIFVNPNSVPYFSVTGQCSNVDIDFLNLTDPQGATIVAYSWDFGDGTISSEVEGSHQFSAGGTYDVALTATTTEGCISIYNEVIEVLQAPNIQIQNSPSYVCIGQGSQLYVAGSFDSYLWSTGYTGPNIFVSESGFYSVEVGDGTCYASDSLFVSEVIIPVTENDFSICEGESITVGASVYHTSGIYTDTLTSSTGCDSVVVSDLNVQPGLEVDIVGQPIVQPFQSYLYAINPFELYNIQWTISGGSIISGQGSNAVEVLWGDNFPLVLTVIVSNENCSYSDTLNIANLTHLEEVSIVGTDMGVYPNPSNGIYQMEGEGVVSVYNSLVEIVLSLAINGKAQIDITNQPKGIYFLQFEEDNGIQTSKLVKQ